MTLFDINSVIVLWISLGGDVERSIKPDSGKVCKVLHANIRGLHTNLVDSIAVTSGYVVLLSLETLVHNVAISSNLCGQSLDSLFTTYLSGQLVHGV